MLHWSLKDSNVFSEEEKERLFKRLKSKLTSDDQLVLSYDQSRSQHKNKDEVFKNLVRLLENGLLKPKRRKKTKPTLASKKRRLDSKKRNAEKKANRKPPSFWGIQNILSDFLKSVDYVHTFFVEIFLFYKNG